MDELLDQILGNLGYSYVVLKSEFNSHDDYLFTIRSNMLATTETPSGQCDQWVKAFSQQSNTQWIVRKTNPNAAKYVYRKKYVCHHSSCNKTEAKNSCKSRSAARYKERKCLAYIEIKIENKTAAQNEDGYSALITVSNRHSHPTQVAEAFSFLGTTEEIVKTFQNYFEQGMTPSGARSFHKMKLLEEFVGVEFEDVEMELADPRRNPTKNQVHYMYKNWKQQ